MDKAFFVIVCCFMFFSPLCSTAGDNPFISREPQKKDCRPPAYTSKFFTKLVVLQQRLNQELARLTKELKTSGQKKALIPLILISFIYGIIHAAGPGHGKTISFSYFLSRRAPVKKGIILGNIISFLHAFSGVVIVLSIYFIFKTSYLSSFEATSQKIKVISYSLIVLIGMVLLIKSLIDLRKSRLKNEDPGFAARPVDNKGIFPIAIAVGMIPCPGVKCPECGGVDVIRNPDKECFGKTRQVVHGCRSCRYRWWRTPLDQEGTDAQTEPQQ